MTTEEKKPAPTYTLLHRIYIHNAVNQEARDPHGYPEAINHPVAIAARREASRAGWRNPFAWFASYWRELRLLRRNSSPAF